MTPSCLSKYYLLYLIQLSLTHSPLKTQLKFSNSKIGIVHYEISGINELTFGKNRIESIMVLKVIFSILDQNLDHFVYICLKF